MAPVAATAFGSEEDARNLVTKVEAQCAVVVLGPIPCRAADKKAANRLERELKKAVDEELAQASQVTALEMEEVDITRAWVESPLKCDENDTLNGISPSSRRLFSGKIPAGVYAAIMSASGLSGKCRRDRDRRDLAGCTLDNYDQRRLSDAPARQMNEEEHAVLHRALQGTSDDVAKKLYESKKLAKTDFFSAINCVCVTCGAGTYAYPETYTDTWEDEEDGMKLSKTYKCDELCDAAWVTPPSA
eukprot:CAMPEP_0116841780 /NCGR_PEP_ID=MMETSP0418-20121206/11140_1 /TAXON_ID=1158023 /ORGANISM="Astrosyne radiata, Strain 13vi08-1A" /LENGTH=244 /DNA_ID=CAMNT_0004472295 /DNA_START=330 /DNA_END=1064 /DNA_ORIENTATION=+